MCITIWICCYLEGRSHHVHQNHLFGGWKELAPLAAIRGDVFRYSCLVLLTLFSHELDHYSSHDRSLVSLGLS